MTDDLREAVARKCYYYSMSWSFPEETIKEYFADKTRQDVKAAYRCARRILAIVAAHKEES